MQATRPINGAPEIGTAISNDIEHHIANARRIRAAALRRAGRRAGRTLGAIGCALRSRLDRWAAARSLRLLSDRSLADLGIPRQAVPLVVRGRDWRSVDTGRPVRAPRADALVQRIEQWRDLQHRRRRMAQELQAYSDRDLEELGLYREDIPRLVRAAA